MALIISLTLSLFISGNQSRKYIPFLFVLVVGILIARPGIWETLFNLFNATFNPQTIQGSSFSYRSELFNVVTNALSKDFIRFIFGHGLGSFYYLELGGSYKGSYDSFLSCDSSWVAFMSDTGYGGFIIMLLLLGKGCFHHLAKYPQDTSPGKSTVDRHLY